MTNKKTVRKEALKILEATPEGMNYTDLRQKIADSTGIPLATVGREIWELGNDSPDIVKPDAGWYQLRKYADKEEEVPSEDTPEQPAKKRARANEKAFYDDFADQLRVALGECTHAISLRSVNVRGKWLTPDVLGTYQFAKDFGFTAQPPRIVSAEIKARVDTNEIFTGFGQACSYKIFSHKVYLAIPESTGKIVPRISALCSLFGIGLVLFNSQNPDKPGWKVRNGATVNEPHYFYVKEVIERVKRNLKKRGLDNLINELF